MNKNDLSIIIPSYNEYECLEKLLPELEHTLNSLNILFEILIIDSIQFSKQTESLCKLYNASYLNRSIDNCYGSAIRTGIDNAKGNNTIIMDSDGSHSPAFIKTLLDSLKDNDIVIASRYIAGGYTENNFLQVFLSKIVNIIFSKSLGIKISDVSNSFRLYRGDSLKTILLECKHFDIQEEILVKLIWNNSAKIIEIPYRFERRAHGKSKRNIMIFIMHYFFSLVKLFLIKIKNKY